MRTRESVNTTVDADLKRMFENTRDVKNLSFGQLMDNAIRGYLIDLNQTNLIDQEITRINLEISILTQELTKLSELKEKIQNLKLIPVEDKNNGSSEKNNGDSFKTNYKQIYEKLGRLTPGNLEKIKAEQNFKTNKEVYEWLRS